MIRHFRALAVAIFFLTASAIAQAAPLSLREALTEAVSRNPLLAEEKLGVDAADQSVTSAFGKHLPRLTLDASYTKRQDPLPFIPAQATAVGPRFSDEFAAWQAILVLPLYQGGQIANGVRLAQVRRAIQENTLTLTRNEIIANTVTRAIRPRLRRSSAFLACSARASTEAWDASRSLPS